MTWTDPNYAHNYYCKNKHRKKKRKPTTEEARTYRLRHTAKYPRKAWWHQAKSKYKIPLEEFDRLMLHQVGTCDICNTQFDDTVKGGPHVDHNHHTGLVRSLLCFSCNAGLGQFKDHLPTIKAAVAYLEKHK